MLENQKKKQTKYFLLPWRYIVYNEQKKIFNLIEIPQKPHQYSSQTHTQLHDQQHCVFFIETLLALELYINTQPSRLSFEKEH